MSSKRAACVSFPSACVVANSTSARSTSSGDVPPSGIISLGKLRPSARCVELPPLAFPEVALKLSIRCLLLRHDTRKVVGAEDVALFQNHGGLNGVLGLRTLPGQSYFSNRLRVFR